MAKAPTSQRPGEDPLNWALRDRSATAGAGAGAAEAAPAGANALLEGFAASMQDSGLDREEQEFLGAYFEQVMQGSATQGEDAPALERSDWMQAVEVLKQAGALDESQANALVRRLDDALQPLRKRNVQLAMEFSRRYAENREQALAWYREQVAATEAGEGQARSPIPSGADALPGFNMITDSRSRRLRGPPR